MNTILIVIDTLRRDHLGCYGNDWIQTPHLDALAQRSAVFENAYLGSYPCMPARRDIVDGTFRVSLARLGSPRTLRPRHR